MMPGGLGSVLAWNLAQDIVFEGKNIQIELKMRVEVSFSRFH
jgi:hypothetical protein